MAQTLALATWKLSSVGRTKWWPHHQVYVWLDVPRKRVFSNLCGERKEKRNKRKSGSWGWIQELTYMNQLARAQQQAIRNRSRYFLAIKVACDWWSLLCLFWLDEVQICWTGTGMRTPTQEAQDGYGWGWGDYSWLKSKSVCVLHYYIMNYVLTKTDLSLISPLLLVLLLPLLLSLEKENSFLY